ncbi:MAG: substrate-binding domain-containing protein, partial [Bacteriovoracaceae bacterium]|nr:substrate-binding domain-containing protein [Bacteriovoracaceae bacterium]
RKIYAGKITNWKKVGGPKLKIKAFQREENSASQLIMQEFMQDLALQKPLEELLFSSMKTGGHWRTAQYRDLPGALGYGLQSYIARTSPQKVKYLAIDGVLPTPENIASRRYPFVREVLAITRTPQSKTIQQLLAWIVGPQGQELVKKTGYVPLNSR